MKPAWLRVKAPTGQTYQQLHQLVREKHLHTVCQSASCPNMGECWELGTATFMILGNTCTRACRFCHVDSSKRPMPPDLDEPKRLAETVHLMNLKHVVITSVTRDDLSDKGATHFARCILAIREKCPQVTIEVLTPDFLGDEKSLDILIKAGVEIFNHNLETVKRLTPSIRSGGKYERSLKVLKTVKEKAPHIKTKTGLMLGLGESDEEIEEAILDIQQHQVDILTLGQYLQPTSWHHPVHRFAHPDIFLKHKNFALGLGFYHVESGPLVRSSYHAHKGL